MTAQCNNVWYVYDGKISRIQDTLDILVKVPWEVDRQAFFVVKVVHYRSS